MMKVGIVVLLVVVVSITTVAYTYLQKEKIPIFSIRNPDLYISSVGGIDFSIDTDKEVYSQGEDVIITAILENKNDTDKEVFLNGWENHSTGVKYIPFNFLVYNDKYINIWSGSTIPSNVSQPILIIPASEYTFNITVNASSEYSVSYVWNQTMSVDGIWKQVPPGSYLVVANVDINWYHYYGGIPFHMFGNQKTITIK